MSAPKIRLVDVSKAFDGHRALDGISLDVADGESLVLIGSSGSGKSLLLKSILGLVPPDTGSIEIDGVDSTGLSENDRMEWMRRFGVLFQRQGLFDSLTVWENVAFRLLQDRSFSNVAAKELAIDKLASVGLTADTADLYPAEISGGMQKRVGLARAIATDPEIIFLDEPTAGLDPIMSNIISELIIAREKELGATIISVVSDMAVVRLIAERVVMLHEGRIVWSGTVDELEATDNPYVHQFVNQLAEGPIQMPSLVS